MAECTAHLMMTAHLMQEVAEVVAEMQDVTVVAGIEAIYGHNLTMSDSDYGITWIAYNYN